jgi:hypothetical protein
VACKLSFAFLGGIACFGMTRLTAASGWPGESWWWLPLPLTFLMYWAVSKRRGW